MTTEYFPAVFFPCKYTSKIRVIHSVRTLLVPRSWSPFSSWPSTCRRSNRLLRSFLLFSTASDQNTWIHFRLQKYLWSFQPHRPRAGNKNSRLTVSCFFFIFYFCLGLKDQVNALRFLYLTKTQTYVNQIFFLFPLIDNTNVFVVPRLLTCCVSVFSSVDVDVVTLSVCSLDPPPPPPLHGGLQRWLS